MVIKQAATTSKKLFQFVRCFRGLGFLNGLLCLSFRPSPRFFRVCSEIMRIFMLVMALKSVAQGEDTENSKVPLPVPIKKSNFSATSASSATLVEQVKKCLPGARINFDKKAATLTNLKADLDEQYFILRTDLLSRTVEYKESDGGMKRLLLLQIKTKLGIPEYRLEIERLDEKGQGSSLEVAKEHRKNPSQIVISSYLSGSEVKLDEKEYLDTRLNELQMNYHLLKEEVTSFKLTSLREKLELSCEQSLQNAAVCICRKPVK